MCYERFQGLASWVEESGVSSDMDRYFCLDGEGWTEKAGQRRARRLEGGLIEEKHMELV